jgi:hypothetical protein
VRFRIRWITVASHITRQRFRERAAWRTSPPHLPTVWHQLVRLLTELRRHAPGGESFGKVTGAPISASGRVVLRSDLRSAPSTQKQKLLDPKRPNREQTPKLGSHPLAYHPHGVRSPVLLALKTTFKANRFRSRSCRAAPSKRGPLETPKLRSSPFLCRSAADFRRAYCSMTSSSKVPGSTAPRFPAAAGPNFAATTYTL